MKQTTLIAAVAAAVIGFSSCNNDSTSSTSTSTDTAAATNSGTAAPPEASAPPLDSAAKMKAWMDYMTPGEPHKMLAAADGKWKTETTMWMDPGAPPQTNTGTATNKMMFGGRYQRSVHNSSMEGMPFEGEGTVAYDNAKKMFVSTWVDNMGTGIMQMEGPWDEAAKSMTLKGTCQDPTTGKECTMREVYKIVDDKHHEMEMYQTNNGKETKVMAMKMTRN
jgi:hypothetical protein